MTQKQTCLDCQKPVCSHCCVEISNAPAKKYETIRRREFLVPKVDNVLLLFRGICLCHVCSEIRDIYKKTGAWFYKGLPNYEMPSRSGDVRFEVREQPVKVPKTTKLGMEIDSDEDDEDSPDAARDEQKIAKNGSFSSTFLKSRNLFNLRLSTDSGSRLTFDTNSLPKKSPVTPYSRQTSSSSSEQKSANSLQPQITEWNGESGTPTPNGSQRQRRNSISSCYSISESSTNEMFSMNQSEFCKN